MFLFSYDMHCTNFGAVGALALRCGSEITTVLATGTLWTMVPRVVRVRLAGSLPSGVMARDVGFRLAHGLANGTYGIDADYLALEMCGPGLDTLPLDERVALCNSVTEIGVCAIYFPPGKAILDWCGARARGPMEAVEADPGAPYAGEIAIDLSAFEPQVALPGAPENAAPLASVMGKRIDHAYIGSCGSGMWGDLETAARILQGRRVAPGVRLLVTPGTEDSARRLAREGLLELLLASGAIVLPPGCGPCAGGASGPLASGEVSISTAAVNTPGRMGAKDAEMFLASPATVAASAIAGRITDPRSYFS
jgi:homoaconitase/3-isopropylmalate dehydratase large subunit